MIDTIRVLHVVGFGYPYFKLACISHLPDGENRLDTFIRLIRNKWRNPYLMHLIQVEAADYQYEKYPLNLLVQGNIEQKIVDLMPVKLHLLLCKSAINHENYLKYWEGHDEPKGNKGLTGKTFEDRIKAAGLKGIMRRQLRQGKVTPL